MTLTVVTSDQSFFEAHNQDLIKAGKPWAGSRVMHVLKTARTLYQGRRSGHVLLVKKNGRKTV